ncbi:MAG: HAD family phosphatase [Firmicutes bacterium]|nr:HAD family phosphatase [Bacillota bacterium]
MEKKSLPDLGRYKAFLFDLDGTLVDSLGVWMEAYSEYLRRHGKVPCSPADLHAEIGGFFAKADGAVNMNEVHMAHLNEAYGIKGLSGAESLAQRDAILAELYMDVRFGVGVAEFLRHWQGVGRKMALVTLSPRFVIDICSNKNPHMMSEVILNDVFGEFVFSSDDGFRKKPHPDGFLLAAKRLGIEPGECLVFEDAIYGVRSGVAAGMDVCVIRERHSAGQRTEIDAQATYIIDSFVDIL